MMLRSSILAPAAIAFVLSAVPGCGPLGEPDDGGSTGGTGGTGAGGAAASGGAGTGGLGTGATGTGGTGGPGTGGTGGLGAGGTGGQNTGGSSAGGSGGGGVEASFDTVRFVIVNAHCSDSSCHNGEVEPRMQDDANLYTTLTTFVSECENLPVVTPGNPERSALVKLINGPCGDIPRMPNGCISEPIEEYTCLPQEYIDAIEQWVANGAPQ